MASKIKEGLRDIKQGVLEKLTGPKYADNLLGESLQDQLRKATAKELVEPSEELNSQARKYRPSRDVGPAARFARAWSMRCDVDNSMDNLHASATE